jgi:arginyl-tRNA synthetase
MNVLSSLRCRFAAALRGLTDDVDDLLGMILPSQDPRHGDYQANCAMPLGRRLGQPPRAIAAELVARLDVADLCHPAEVAGPGFINLRIRDDWLAGQLEQMLYDEDRLGVARVTNPRTYILDYSAPNVAKSLHVGHIRSTVIGDSLNRLLRLLGHKTISDNHIGDWGTQFGMIIYGYKHFCDRQAYDRSPLDELGRLYRLVNSLIRYHALCTTTLAALDRDIATAAERVEWHAAQVAPTQGRDRKKFAKEKRQAEAEFAQLNAERARCQADVDALDRNPEEAARAAAHPNIQQAVLAETAKLHAGDPANLALWKEFTAPCLAGIESIYRRLGVTFDQTLGESFYHDRLAAVVDDLRDKGLARTSDGAACVFLDGYETPMIVQKRDGAFLYATTDLATIQYRVETFCPNAILYVVGQPQTLHFEQLFAVARRWGYTDLDLEHVRFGTVLGEDRRPFKTRSGDVVGLSGLLDEAVARAAQIVAANDDARPRPELSATQRARIAEIVGIAAVKYADLSQNRESDYVFSYDKMLAMKGNTATYMQYSYARVRSIFARGGIDCTALRQQPGSITLDHPAERSLGLTLVRLSESLERAAADYRPSHLTAYLFELAGRYAEFFESCPVLRAENEATRQRRLKLCDLTGRTLKLGLSLLGIDVVDKM